METLTITNDKGRKFRVQIVKKGDKWGLNKCLTHDEDDPLIEFYDLTYPETFGAEGQFVSNYSLSTLREHARGVGLDMYGGEPAWKIDGATFQKVMDWLPKRPEAEIIKDIRQTHCELSPENLHCDGEISATEARRKEAKLNRKLAELERELGRKPTDKEIYSP